MMILFMDHQPYFGEAYTGSENGEQLKEKNEFFKYFFYINRT